MGKNAMYRRRGSFRPSDAPPVSTLSAPDPGAFNVSEENSGFPFVSRFFLDSAGGDYPAGAVAVRWRMGPPDDPTGTDGFSALVSLPVEMGELVGESAPMAYSLAWCDLDGNVVSGWCPTTNFEY